ncbi:MAG: BTAD domain-containing putative transcriptional regulator [Oscillospiraceae bacterium]
MLVGNYDTGLLLAHNSKPLALLQYLIAFRKSRLGKQQLIECLWPNGSSNQPEMALKNLVYRIRSKFSEIEKIYGAPGVEYQNGTYHFSEAFEVSSDFENFEDLFNRASSSGVSSKERVSLYGRAISLYRGDFLALQPDQDWVLSLRAYYRSVYLSCIERSLALLEDLALYKDLEALCRKLLATEPFEESLHLAYMQALVQQGKNAAALSHYDYMHELFLRELRTSPSEELHKFAAALQRKTGSAQRDLLSFKERLRESKTPHTAFYRGLEVFRSIYQLTVRSSERTGQPFCLALLTLSERPNTAVTDEEKTDSMQVLLASLHTSLRRSDIVAPFSKNQYILLLPTSTAKNAGLVIDRILQNFNSGTIAPGLVLSSELDHFGQNIYPPYSANL